jgi:hypothetical protein
MSPRLTCSSIHPLRAARVPTGRPWSRKPTGSTRHQGRYGTTTQLTVPSDHCMEVVQRQARRVHRRRMPRSCLPQFQCQGRSRPGRAGGSPGGLLVSDLNTKPDWKTPLAMPDSQFSERVSEWQQGQRQELSCMCGVVKLPRGPTLGRGGIVTRAESGRATWLARGHAQYPIAPWPGLVLDHVGGRR